jgi:DNA modification methylase
MYYYPDNIQESILIFQKGRFDYSHLQEMDAKILSESKIPIDDYQKQEWYLTVWNITNVLPRGDRLEKGIAAFPEEIPKRLIKLFSYFGETVLDPFLGSGTTVKVARELGRSSWGYEIDLELKKIIKAKFNSNHPSDSRLVFVKGRNARRLRSTFQRRVRNQVSVTKKGSRVAKPQVNCSNRAV